MCCEPVDDCMMQGLEFLFVACVHHAMHVPSSVLCVEETIQSLCTQRDPSPPSHQQHSPPTATNTPHFRFRTPTKPSHSLLSPIHSQISLRFSCLSVCSCAAPASPLAMACAEVAAAIMVAWLLQLLQCLCPPQKRRALLQLSAGLQQQAWSIWYPQAGSRSSGGRA